eukprot:7986543-Ditylum_brightwellii.AAC.1
MDAKLMENQHKATFEMQTIIYANNNWTEFIKLEISEECKKMTRDRMCKLLEDAVKCQEAARSGSTGSADAPSPSNNNNNNIAVHDDNKDDNNMLQQLILETSDGAQESTNTSTGPPNAATEAATEAAV